MADPLKDVPIAPLPTIHHRLLLSRDRCEISRLVDVCRTHGFFYLQFTDSQAEHLMRKSSDVVDLMRDYFSQPLETKLKDVRGSVTHGYCPTGQYTGAKRGERDCYETLKISTAEMMVRASQLPTVVHQHTELFSDFISGSHQALITILESLSIGMNLDETERFEDYHRLKEPACTTMVLFRYPRQVQEGEGIGHNMHTDIGSLTLLYCRDWGLQLLTPETNGWGFVEPRPGHAIVNVGDSLRFLSHNRLVSCVHRVIPLTERQETDRYSIAYFLRAEDQAGFVDSKGRKLSARAWHDEKYEVFRQPHETQERDAILTGGMEKHVVLTMA